MLEAPRAPIRVLLADDSELVRRGVKSVLSAVAAELCVVAEAGSVGQAVSESLRHKPDVVLLDVRFPDGTGFDACRQILQQRPATRIVILTAHASDSLIYDAIVAGAHGYLMKEIDAAGLVRALRDVAAGLSIIDPDATSRMLRLLRGGNEGGNGPNLSVLSTQERRVLALVADGLTNKQVGEQLSLSENTVKNYLVNVFEKLGVKRRAQAAAIFVQQNAVKS